MSDFRELVRLKRKDAGLSQKKLGEACGLSDTTISKIEGGSRETPQWDTLCKIAQALKFHPFEILLAAGYITEDDIHPNSQIHGLENLNEAGLEEVQLFIDFLQEREKKMNAPNKEE